MLKATSASLKICTRSMRTSTSGRLSARPSVFRPAVAASFATTATSAASAYEVTASSKHFSDKKFKDAPISKASKGALTHIYLSDVQAATLAPGLAGDDLLVQAKTGTGKTLAFLLPAIERLVSPSTPAVDKQLVSILVLSPTRELALQIKKEAEVLMKPHSLRAQHAIGGTASAKADVARISSNCDILIATPGRLNDMIQNCGFAPKLAGVRTLVLDEADRLLDQGFKKELDEILNSLPPKTQGPRQTLLFSATVSPQIKEVAFKALRPNHKFVSTLLPDEVNTHQHVPQASIIAPFEDHFPILLSLLQQDGIQNPRSSKVMVFFPTARHVSIATEIFEAIRKDNPYSFAGVGPIGQIHSRLSQGARSKAAETFKSQKEAVFLSSDVSARGMDFPGVTHVIQVGLPANAEQYIHRLGRTARAGASGNGTIILSPEESSFLKQRDVAALNILPMLVPETTPTSRQLVQKAIASPHVNNDTKASAYRAWLGYYNGACKTCGWSKPQLIEAAAQYVTKALGWADSLMPPIETKAVGMMGLKNMGLNVVKAKRPAAGR